MGKILQDQLQAEKGSYIAGCEGRGGIVFQFLYRVLEIRGVKFAVQIVAICPRQYE